MGVMLYRFLIAQHTINKSITQEAASIAASKPNYGLLDTIVRHAQMASITLYDIDLCSDGSTFEVARAIRRSA